MIETDMSEQSIFAFKVIEPGADLEQIQAFRYSVFVEKMGQRNISVIDHENKRLRGDLLDESARVFVVEHESKIVGSFRVNMLNHIDPSTNFVSEVRQRLKLAPFETSFAGSISFTSRLCVDVEHRGSQVLHLLLLEGFEKILLSGIDFDFFYCEPSLIELYEQLGYRRYTENFVDPEFGYRVPMVLVMKDHDYLISIGSPFTRILDKHPEFLSPQKSVIWFNETFASTIHETTIHHDQQGNIWTNFEEKFQPGALSTAPIFQGLSKQEVARVVKGGSILTCRAGDTVIREKDYGNSMFVMLSGAAKMYLGDGQKILAEYTTGSVFGEIALVTETSRVVNVTMTEDSEVLVFSRKNLHRLMKTQPQLISKILLNLSQILGARLISATYDAYAPHRARAQSIGNDESSPFGSYSFSTFGANDQELQRLEHQATAAWEIERNMLRKSGLMRGTRVLDLACGPGFISRKIATEIGPLGEVVGIDLNDELLVVAQNIARDWQQNGGASGAELSFRKGDVYQLDLPENYFDLVIARFLFQHLERPADALVEIQRVLKPGGRLIVADVDDSAFSLYPEPPEFSALMDLATAAQRTLGGDRQVGRKLPYYLKRSGFKDVMTDIVVVSSDDLGLEQFLAITTRFKLEFLPPEKRQQAADMLDKIVKDARKDGVVHAMTGVYAVSGRTA